MNLDYLAWAILALAFVFMLLPFLGAWDSHCHGYLDAMAIGFTIVLGLCLIFLVPAAIIWALIRIFA